MAFLRYYFDQLNSSYTQPSDTLIPPLGTSSCGFCRNSEESIGELIESGQRYQSDPVKIAGVAPFGGASKEEQYIALEIRQSAAKILDSKGDVVRTAKRTTVRANAAVVWHDGGWRLRGIEKAA